MVESIGIKDDESMFEEYRLMERAREHLQELTPTEKLALQAFDINVLRDSKTGKNVII
jgi:hypothetical protein